MKLSARQLARVVFTETPRKPGTLDRVELPLPPSNNALFVQTTNRKTGKPLRVKTKEYKVWLAIASPLMVQLKSPDAYPVVCMYLLSGALNEARDGANCEKALTDCAVAMGVIPDDCLKYVASGHWFYDPGPEPPKVVVWFEPMLRAKKEVG